MTQPVDPIPVQPPVPSILTAARDRSGDGFGRPPIDVEGAGDRTQRAQWARGGGISWQSFACQESFPWRGCGVDDGEEEAATKEISSTGGPVTSSPFVIYTPLECEWAGAEDSLDSAARSLTEAHTAFGMARALWMGEGLPDAVTQPTLRNSATAVGGGAGDLDDVVAMLLAEYEDGTHGNGGAVLHIPSILMTGALGGLPGGGKVATIEGNIYRGPLGSVISPGPGYPRGASTLGAGGFGPMTDDEPPTYAGNAADEVWIYVTGPVEYALGDVFVDRSQTGATLRRNVVEVVAERMAIFRFDPCSVWGALAWNTTTTSQTGETS